MSAALFSDRESNYSTKNQSYSSTSGAAIKRRNSMRISNATPGPGDYRILSVFGKYKMYDPDVNKEVSKKKQSKKKRP